ncbi:MAG: hypothetical protein ABMA01_13975 [Chthoniobacteraceae bacterium]
MKGNPCACVVSLEFEMILNTATEAGDLVQWRGAKCSPGLQPVHLPHLDLYTASQQTSQRAEAQDYFHTKLRDSEQASTEGLWITHALHAQSGADG